MGSSTTAALSGSVSRVSGSGSASGVGTVAPPPPGAIELHTMLFDADNNFTQARTNVRANAVCFRKQHISGQFYQRFQYHVVHTTTAFTLRFETFLGGTHYFRSSGYALLVGDGTNPGVERARTMVSPTATWANFVGNFGSEADGPYLFEIRCLDALGNYKTIDTTTEFGVPYWMWIDRGGTAKDHPMVVFQNGDYEWEFSDCAFRWALVPKAMLKTRQVPYDWWYIPTVDTATNDQPGIVPPHIFPGGEPFSTAAAKTTITRRNVVPTTGPAGSDLGERRPAKTKRGITVTENIQGYLKNHVIGICPQQPILDGPRGLATCYSPVALWPGHSGVIYGMDAWSFFKLNLDGSRTTMAGLRHTEPLYWEDMITPGTVRGDLVADLNEIPGVEVRGEWDPAIPYSKRFPWEAWGFTFDQRTVIPHNPADQVFLNPFGYLAAHYPVGPVAFCSCRFNRILKFQFFKEDGTRPPYVSEWVTGLNDPWGISMDRGMLGKVIFVAERGSHQITMWSADTPQTPCDVDGNPVAAGQNVLIGNPTAGTTFGVVDPYLRKFIWTAPYTANKTPDPKNSPADFNLLRQQPILAPEGLDVQDGYVYWGAAALYEVRRINLQTRVVERVCRPAMNVTQSIYLELRVSDGSFGPRNTVFTSTWDNQNNGRPRAFVPGSGVDPLDGTTLTHKTEWVWQGGVREVPEGAGGYTCAEGYASAMGVNNGMFAAGTSSKGLSVFMQTVAGDTTPNLAAAKAGRDYYYAQGHYLLHGQCGFGYIDMDLPWGEDPTGNCDYWLRLSGHDVPTPPPVEVLPQWLEDAGNPILTWVAIPDTQLSAMTIAEIQPLIDAGLCSATGGMIGYGHPRRGIMDYSGGTLKTDGSEFLLFGGGGGTDPTIEGSWAGNDVRGLRLEDDAPRWRIRIAPSNASALWYRSPVSAALSDPTHAYMKDGRPNARHSYWAPQFVDSTNTFWSVGCRNTWERDESATGEMDKVDSVVLTDGAWSASSSGVHPDFPSMSDADDTWCVKDSQDRFYVALRDGTVARFDYRTNLWTVLSITGIPPQVEGAFSLGRAYCAYDPRRNRIFRIGNNTLEGANQFAMIDLDTMTWINATLLQGPDVAKIQGGLYVLGRFGMCWDPGRDSAIVFIDDGKLYGVTCLEDDSWWVQALTLAGTAPTSGASSVHGGALSHVWSRMQYVPNLNGICLVQAYNRPVYFVRTS